jgi:hypothetical protein
MSDAPGPSLIPFVIAVTGHRDLRPGDIEPLREQVRNVFAELRRRMPSTPVILLSGLAEGADQLVAEVALEENASLVAALPMPLEIYKTTMGPAARAKMESLLALAINRITLPLVGVKAEELFGNDAARAQCYETLALFLARHGQALIALWDGKHSDRKGGTSQVVHYVRFGAPGAEAEVNEGSHCGVVYQVVTPRMSGSGEAPRVRMVSIGCERRPVARERAVELDEAEGPPRTTFAQVETYIERFNRDALKSTAAGASFVPKLIRSPEVVLSPFQKKLQALYWQADVISLRANERRRWVLGTILVTAIVGTLFYGIHGEMLEPRVELWFTFPAFVLAALLLHRAARARHVEETYLDARAFAEAVRVQFFWELAGLKQPVDRHYLMDRRVDVDWIRFALKNVWLLRDESEDAVTPEPRLVLDHWVKGQERWYGSKARAQAQKVRGREKWSQYGLIAAVGWSILVPASILIHGPWRHFAPWNKLGPNNWVYQVFHVALAVPALLAGAYRFWIEQAGYEEQSREYRFMERKFASRARELEVPSTSLERAQRLVLELGVAALDENGRWLLLHRERPLEVLSSP